MEGCGFRDRKAEFDTKNAEIVGVSFDTPEDNEAFAQKFDFNFPLLCDTDKKVGLAYGACKAPTDGAARRIGVVIDPEGKVKEYLPKVDAASYPEQVLKRL